MSPITLRLRECGLTSPRNRFTALLNLRCVAFRRELKDKHLKYDEMIAPRNDAFECWWDTKCRHHTARSRIEAHARYHAAAARVQAASRRKAKRIHNLKAMLALVKTTLTKRR